MKTSVGGAIVVASLLIWSLSLNGSAAGQEPGPEFCTTGPYVFHGVNSGVANNLPSVRRGMSAFGLFAMKSNCSIRIACVQPATEDKAALREGRRTATALCNTARQMLVRHSFRVPRGNPILTEANADLRNAINVEVVTADHQLQPGSVLAYLAPGP